MNPSKVTIHMVSSLDGFIANQEGDVDWMTPHDSYPQGKILTKDDIEKFVNSIDCYVMGSRTYDHARELGWPYGETPVIVLSHRQRSSDKKSVQFYRGELHHLIHDQLKVKFQNIWVVGGAETIKSFVQSQLVDEIVITIMPILLGHGLPFFNNIGLEIKLHLLNSVAYNDGMVELTYQVLGNEV